MGWHGNAMMAWYEKPLVKIKNPNSSWSRELTDDAIKNVIKSQLRSVYGLDYADIYRRPELSHLKPAEENHLPKLEKQRTQIYDSNTESRFHYRTPIKVNEFLRVPTGRFGSRKY